MTWHIGEPTWQAYAAGRLDPAAEAAVETHVTACPDCRAGARTLLPDPEPLWRSVHAEITTPPLPAPLRVLARLGVPAADLVVLASARDLLLSWSVAVGGAVLCALLTGLAPIHVPGGPQVLFLVLAPLVPALAVVATYDATEPFREVTDAAPFSKVRLALLRTAAALTAAVPLTCAVALAVPVLHGYFAAWLLPGLALTVATLVLMTRLNAWLAGGVACAGWLVAASVAVEARAVEGVAEAGGQLAFAGAVVMLGVLFVRSSTVQPTRGVVR